jgi:hypothetical protein
VNGWRVLRSCSGLELMRRLRDQLPEQLSSAERVPLFSAWWASRRFRGVETSATIETEPATQPTNHTRQGPVLAELGRSVTSLTLSWTFQARHGDSGTQTRYSRWGASWGLIHRCETLALWFGDSKWFKRWFRPRRLDPAGLQSSAFRSPISHEAGRSGVARPFPSLTRQK